MNNLIKYFIALMVAMLISIHVVNAKSIIKLSWRVVTIEQAPRPGTHISHQSVTYVLDGDNISIPGYAPNARLGQESHGVNGNKNQYTNKYSINNGRISIKTMFSGNYIITNINTDGVQSCSASIDYTPIAGQSLEFGNRISNHEAMTISGRYADQIICAIHKY